MVIIVIKVIMVKMVMVVEKHVMVVMVTIIMVVKVVRVVMVIMVIRTDRTRPDRTFKLDFPGNLCRAAFAILAMFSSKVRHALAPGLCQVNEGRPASIIVSSLNFLILTNTKVFKSLQKMQVVGFPSF